MVRWEEELEADVELQNSYQSNQLSQFEGQFSDMVSVNCLDGIVDLNGDIFPIRDTITGDKPLDPVKVEGLCQDQ